MVTFANPYSPTERPQPERDHWGRPYVVPPTGGKPVPYTRTTTFVSAVEDMYKLGQWQQRHVARGVAFHDDLLAAIRDTDVEDRSTLNRLVDEAKERSGAGDAARHGTYLHSVTEAYDLGEDPSEVPRPLQSYGELDSMSYLPDLAAYIAETEPLKAVNVELFTVNDPLKVAGTTDRVVEYEGKRYIADLKTGSIEHGIVKISAQLAMYARSRPYDFQKHERLEPHGCEVDRGIVIHLPAGKGVCQLYWVDLLKGWEAVMRARDMRSLRQLRFTDLSRPLVPFPQGPPNTLAQLIDAAMSRDEMTALWVEHRSEWTAEHTDLAQRRFAALDHPSADAERTTLS